MAGSAGYPTLSRVLVWRLGASTLTAISEPAVTHSEPQLAAAPDGRIWVGWIRNAGGKQVLVVRRSNRPASAFGAPVRVSSPGGWAIGSFEASATADHLDVLGQFSVGSSNSLRHTGRPAGAHPRPDARGAQTDGRRTVTYRVLDVGDPVAGALVRVGSVARRTAANGRVTLASAAPCTLPLPRRATPAPLDLGLPGRSTPSAEPDVRRGVPPLIMGGDLRRRLCVRLPGPRP